MSELPPPTPSPLFDPHMFPTARRPWWQFIFDHNPCLLLSTVFMLLGCYLINSTLNVASGDLLKLLALIGTINLYELCIIPLGLLLIRRSKATARDGWWLLLFETLFLVNGTFLHVDPHVLGGWWLNIAMLLLALVKAAVVFHGLKLGFGLRTFGFLAFQLTFIYCLPIFFWYASPAGEMPPHLMYAVWWIVGMLPIAYDLLARADKTTPQFDLVQTVLRRTYLIAPWVMLVIHLRFAHWAHHAEFVLADLAPVCLGLAVAATRLCLPAPILTLTRALPFVALILTIDAPADLAWPMPFTTAFAIRPGMLILVGTLLTCSYLISFWATLWTATVLTIAICTYLAQDYVFATLNFSARQSGRLFTAAGNLIPRTAGAWGIVAVIAAFLLLAVGAHFSLRRSRTDVPEP